MIVVNDNKQSELIIKDVTPVSQANEATHVPPRTVSADRNESNEVNLNDHQNKQEE